MKRTIIIFALFALYSIITDSSAHAQFWHALPAIDSSTRNGIGNVGDATFSNDEKRVFYLSGGNVFSLVIADKYSRITATPGMTPTQVTKFTDRPIVRFVHLTNRPEIIFMRLGENGKDYHIYKQKDDGSDQPQDLSGDANAEIIGLSYNGRYVYYTANKVHKDKVDCYRYDTQQYTSDLILPNDRNWRVLSWTRDQKKILIARPNPGAALMLYDIESTERTRLGDPGNTGSFMGALLDPAGNLVMSASAWTDYSPNGKYQIFDDGDKWRVHDIATNTDLSLPAAARPLAIAPKETMLVYSDGGKIYLYEMVKKATVELAAVKQ
ncbi:MAG: hypothetical protein Q8922_08040 [Bacteroidota bacterium]|nr:hypothetical protein [Bacteroidota bacterium]MDP4234173.1 hypothetical protein [Bacteroidota bacterium]MDP4243761.1 hypothetical protein [Bacteroidota bacterium]MDP4287874.1 hypothetical protein [Bacteroidota bacterium]